MPQWLVNLLVSVAISFIAVIIQPKVKVRKPEAVTQAENPTADAGKPIGVLFGTAWIKEVNVIGYWDKSTRQFHVAA